MARAGFLCEPERSPERRWSYPHIGADRSSEHVPTPDSAGVASAAGPREHHCPS